MEMEEEGDRAPRSVPRRGPSQEAVVLDQRDLVLASYRASRTAWLDDKVRGRPSWRIVGPELFRGASTTGDDLG